MIASRTRSDSPAFSSALDFVRLCEAVVASSLRRSRKPDTCPGMLVSLRPTSGPGRGRTRPLLRDDPGGPSRFDRWLPAQRSRRGTRRRSGWPTDRNLRVGDRVRGTCRRTRLSPGASRLHHRVRRRVDRGCPSTHAASVGGGARGRDRDATTVTRPMATSSAPTMWRGRTRRGDARRSVVAVEMDMSALVDGRARRDLVGGGVAVTSLSPEHSHRRQAPPTSVDTP